MAAEKTMIEVAGREVAITSPDKVFFPKAGLTKLDLVDYYRAVEGPLMRAMQGRPVLLERYPQGAGGKSFFQKRIPDSAPDWLQTTTVSTPNGTTARALVIADLAHVLWAVNQGCLGFHVWPFKAADPDHADELRIDLDPSPGVGLEQIKEAADLVRSFFVELGLRSFVKTSGSKGLHIYARILPEWSSYDVRAAAVALARELERRRPDLVTAAWWKEERGERVFIDFNQNAPHKTVFGAWSARPRVGAQASTPLAWDELATVVPDELTIDVVPARVAEHGDPWETNTPTQSLDPLLDYARRDAENGLLDAPWPPVYPKMPNEPPRVAPSRAKKQA
jgi:DNA ligase D